MKIFAHRGYSGKYPENTILAFKKALDIGVDGIELDVHKSKDGKLVVIHDEDIKRTFDGEGLIKDYTLKELQDFKCKDLKFFNNEECKICTLEDVIEIGSKLLKDLGEFYMVHRAERLVDIMCLLRKYKLEPKNIRFVHSKPDEKPSLILIRAVRGAKEFLKIDKPLVIYNENGDYTDEILEIYNKNKGK
jgi:hypothetical protein